MTDETTELDPREQLRIVDEELAGLRRMAEGLRSQVGERADGTSDLSDRASLITAAEEQEALIGVLQARRERLQRQIS
jgi:hypothetical protein